MPASTARDIIGVDRGDGLAIRQASELNDHLKGLIGEESRPSGRRWSPVRLRTILGGREPATARPPHPRVRPPNAAANAAAEQLTGRPYLSQLAAGSGRVARSGPAAWSRASEAKGCNRRQLRKVACGFSCIECVVRLVGGRKRTRGNRGGVRTGVMVHYAAKTAGYRSAGGTRLTNSGRWARIWPPARNSTQYLPAVFS